MIITATKKWAFIKIVENRKITKYMKIRHKINDEKGHIITVLHAHTKKVQNEMDNKLNAWKY